MAVYPPGRADGVEVRGSDLARLEADEFLNDTVIDLYIRCVHGGYYWLLAWLPSKTQLFSLSHQFICVEYENFPDVYCLCFFLR